MTNNPVHHPKHYTSHPSGVECLTIIRHMTFNIGAAMKYLWRHGLKDGETAVQDLEKAVFYIQDEIRRLKEPLGFGQQSELVDTINEEVQLTLNRLVNLIESAGIDKLSREVENGRGPWEAMMKDTVRRARELLR